MRNVTFHPIQQVDEDHIKYAVLAARYNGQWIFCRHKSRPTWELPGGHREPGETPLETARRELYEETGAVDFDIRIVGAYKLNDFGLLCFAEVHKLESIPTDSEIAEIRLMDTLPENLTYGDVHTQLHNWVQGWLNMQSGAGELWDIYDANRNLTGRIHRRGDFLTPGDYHLVVHVWVQNSQGQFLLTKRSPNKGFPNMWETTGGSALAGDDSLTAAIREMQEETGYHLLPQNGRCVISYRGDDHFSDVWHFKPDLDLAKTKLPEGETCDAMHAYKETIVEMRKQGILVPFRYLDAFFDMIE